MSLAFAQSRPEVLLRGIDGYSLLEAMFLGTQVLTQHQRSPHRLCRDRRLFQLSQMLQASTASCSVRFGCLEMFGSCIGFSPGSAPIASQVDHKQAGRLWEQ